MKQNLAPIANYRVGTLKQLLVTLAIWLGVGLVLNAEEPAKAPLAEDSPRRTETVRIIERCMPSVVAIRSYTPHKNPGVFYIHNGSGSIVHESGYILTNEHVVMNAVRGDVLLNDDRVVPYRIVARFRHEDMALLKIDVKEKLASLPLGRSHDLMLGEPVLIIGSPGGLIKSVSTGIVSGLNRSTTTEHTFLPWMIQTSAASSGGNSGGPLVNALGMQIGVVTAEKKELEAVNFAIAIDRVREILPQMIAAEQRYGFWHGIQIDSLADSAKVTSVAPDSPAAEAEIQPGDVLHSLDQFDLRKGMDFHLALIDRKQGQAIKLHIARGEDERDVELKLAELPTAEPVEDKDMKNGLQFAAYEGQWQTVPDVAILKPVKQGTTNRPDINAHKPRGDNFALRYSSFVKIPTEGLYTFFTSSDDGSKLFIGERLVVNNDGLHPPRESAGVIRLKAGLHPITILMFEASGGEALSVSIEGPNLKKQEIAPESFFIRKQDEPQPSD
jgi:S1-C subfamily serine protease